MSTEVMFRILNRTSQLCYRNVRIAKFLYKVNYFRKLLQFLIASIQSRRYTRRLFEIGGSFQGLVIDLYRSFGESRREVIVATGSVPVIKRKEPYQSVQERRYHESSIAVPHQIEFFVLRPGHRRHPSSVGFRSEGAGGGIRSKQTANTDQQWERRPQAIGPRVLEGTRFGTQTNFLGRL
jgi:hypothetical protein